VAKELKTSGFLVDPTAAEAALENIGRAWHGETAGA
jgi:hypothetical protein